MYIFGTEYFPLMIHQYLITLEYEGKNLSNSSVLLFCLIMIVVDFFFNKLIIWLSSICQ